MTVLNQQRKQAINRNFSSVIDFLDRNFYKSRIQLPGVPSYLHKGKTSKLEITVFSNPKIAKIDVRIIGLNNYDREPAFECNYDLEGLSMSTFKREIDDLISRMN